MSSPAPYFSQYGKQFQEKIFQGLFPLVALGRTTAICVYLPAFGTPSKENVCALSPLS